MDKIHDSMHRHGLVRSRDGQIFGGVISGLGRRFDVDPWPARVLFVAGLMLLPGSQFLIYPLLWVLMPAQADATARTYS